MDRRDVLEERLRSHPERVADWLAEFAGGEHTDSRGISTGVVSKGAAAAAAALRSRSFSVVDTNIIAQALSSSSSSSSSTAPKLQVAPLDESAFTMLPTSSPMSRAVSAGSVLLHQLHNSSGSGPPPIQLQAAALPLTHAASNSGSTSAGSSSSSGSSSSLFASPISEVTSKSSPFTAAAAAAFATQQATTAAQSYAAVAATATSPLTPTVASPSSDHVVSLAAFERCILQTPVEQLLSRALEWDFEIFDFHARTGEHALLYLSCHMLRQLGLLQAFPHLSLPKFFSFFLAIERGYNSVIPYHTSVHGCDVMQGMVYFMRSPLLRTTLSPLDVLAGLVAAGCHDYEHLGRNNAFMVATAHPLALLYNDISVMENHHAAASWKVLMQPAHDFLATFPAAERAEFRTSFISAILHTDMSMHTKGVAEFQDSMKAKRAAGEWFSAASKEDRKLLLDMACHVSDLGNPAKPAPLAREWTARVVQEFFQQGDAERAAGLKVSPMMDRSKAAVDAQQFGFIDFVVGPLFNTWGDALEPSAIAPCLEHLAINKAFFKERIAAKPAEGVTQAPAQQQPPQTATATAAATASAPSSSSLGGVAAGAVVATSLFPPSPSLHFFPASALCFSPWKNGGGMTRELLCWPAGSSLAADDYLWRCSSATVEYRVGEAGVPFSSFPDRTRLLLLTGCVGSAQALRLCIKGVQQPMDMQPVTLTQDDSSSDSSSHSEASSIVCFDGSAEMTAQILQAPHSSAPVADALVPSVSDLGLIFSTRLLQAAAHVQRLAQGQTMRTSAASPRAQILVVLLQGQISVAAPGVFATSSAATATASSATTVTSVRLSAALDSVLLNPASSTVAASTSSSSSVPSASLSLELTGQAPHSVAVLFVIEPLSAQ